MRNQHKPRGGYPCKRDRKREPSLKRGVQYANWLNSYKKITKKGIKKVYVLHATKGWRLYT